MKIKKETFDTPNLNAPRMRKGKFSTQIVTRELFSRFKESLPEYKEMSWKEFSALWGDIAKTIREETVTNPLGVKLNFYTGELKTQYLPYKFEATDAGTSLTLGIRVNNLSIVTRGKTAKIKWERRWAVKMNKMLQFYGFEPTREINLIAKQYILSNPEKVRISRNTIGGRRTWS